MGRGGRGVRSMGVCMVIDRGVQGGKDARGVGSAACWHVRVRDGREGRIHASMEQKGKGRTVRDITGPGGI